MAIPDALGIIAGNGVYPLQLASAARAAGVKRLVAAAFTGETQAALADKVDVIEWLRVGQLGRMLNFFRAANVTHAIMAGQIAPKNLFDLRPDLKALVVLARLKRRNAESLFRAIADELSKIGVELLPAYTFLENLLAPAGLIAGRALNRREEADITFGFEIAKEVSRLDIGQTVVVKNGTVLAVEAFEGTNDAMQRGGALGRTGAIVIKVAKPGQDMRFDVPVIGAATLAVAAAAKIRVIALEAGRTLLLEKNELVEAAERAGISIVGR
ncbi:MAG: LpxI family protein [Chthoniobacterales bacterium]